MTESGNREIDSRSRQAIELVTKDPVKNFNTAIKLAERAGQIAEKNNLPKGIAVACFAQATILVKMGSYKTAEEAVSRAIKASEKIEDAGARSEMMAYSYHYMAYIFQSQSNWQRSLDNYYKALDFVKDKKDPSQAALILTKIGDIFQAMGDTKNAEKYFTEALQKNKQGNNPVIAIQIYISYANLLTETRPDSAIEISNEALRIAQQNKIENKDYNIYFGLAGAYFMKKDFARAIESMNSAIENARQYKKPLTQYYIGFAEIYGAMNQPAQSENYYRQAIAEAQKDRDLYMEYQATAMLKAFYERTGQTGKLLEVTEKAGMLKDSIYTEKQAMAIQELDYRYQTEKKQAEINSLTRANRLKTYLMIASFVALVSIILLFINRRKQSRLKEKYYKSREAMLQQEAQIANQNAQIEKENKEKALLGERLKEEENLRLQNEIESTHRELASTTLYVQEKNKLLENLQEQISKFLVKDNLQSRNELMAISKNIKNQISFENDWSKIKLHFEKVHPEFFDKLSAICPALTQNDLKNCAYIKMKLNHKEIASLMGLDYNSVKMARYRIKKKLNLSQEEDLNQYIESL